MSEQQQITVSRAADKIRDAIERTPGLAVWGSSGNGEVERLYVMVDGREFFVSVTARAA